ncbi:uncharacterized protein LOC110812513 isoform X2 [Carica papaya]|nr:uncharacterized protein LOC110812513 isoform X2 [Carica papaya]
MLSHCFGTPATLEVVVSAEKSLREPVEGNSGQLKHCHIRECSVNSETMEHNAGISRSNVKQSLQSSMPTKEGKRPKENNPNTSTFINHAAIAWQESRKKWVGEQPQQHRMAKDPIISWSTTYEELLSSNEPFSKPIPLPEMVDFLVDIWQDEGLYD